MPTPTLSATVFALAGLLAAGCAAFDPNNVITRRMTPGPEGGNSPVPIPATASLGERERKAAIDFVWTTVNERYFDPKLNGIDWPAARARWEPLALGASDDDRFWETLDRMTGEMRDAHTRVESPRSAALAERFESVSLGFGFRPLEGGLVVTAVRPESDAWWAGVRPGMALAEVAGEPASAVYAKWLSEARESSTPQARHAAAARRLAAGEPGSKAELAFERGDGSRFTATLRRERFTSPPRVVHRVLPSGLGYIRLSSWQQSLQSPMIDAIEALKSAPGIIIDLRGNPGGSALMVRNVAARFFEGKVDAGRALTRTGKPITVAFEMVELVKLRQEIEGTGTYKGPVAVLVSAESASGSELFAGILQSHKRATVIGETTCGCLLAFLGYAAVPGGGRLAYSEVGFAFPDGARIEGRGVVPDKPLALNAADLRASRDRVLEEAQAVLKVKAAEAADAKPVGR
jgi:carboxyl-terminal processing protease